MVPSQSSTTFTSEYVYGIFVSVHFVLAFVEVKKKEKKKRKKKDKLN
jgi:hypothetical protein